MCVLGAADDRLRLSPRVRIWVEVAAAVGALALGFRFAPALPAELSFVLTILFVVGMVNALNLMDNMDGLAASVTAVTSFVAGLLCLLGHDTFGAVLAFSVTGAAAGFLLYNAAPAKIFMGDSGSLCLGFVLAIISLRAQRVVGLHSSEVVALLAPLLINSMLICDTTMVTILRITSGRPISQGGRDHLSHRLVKAGLSERAAVGAITTAAAMIGAVPVLDFLLPGSQFVLASVMIAVVLLCIVSVAARQNVYADEMASARGQGLQNVPRP